MACRFSQSTQFDPLLPAVERRIGDPFASGAASEWRGKVACGTIEFMRMVRLVMLVFEPGNRTRPNSRLANRPRNRGAVG